MTTPTFQFVSSAYAADTFTVVDFQGNEALSSLFSFDIGLKCDDAQAVDLHTLLGAAATLTLQGAQANHYSGMLARVEQQQQAGGYNYYRVLLVPPAWKLSLSIRSAGFAGMTAPAIVEQVLENAGLSCGTSTSANTDVSTGDITGTYPERDFTCQYVESDLDFVCRLMEYEGIYFYLADNSGACQMILADGNAYPNAVQVPFADPTSTNNYDSITVITRCVEQATVEVTVTGYDYQNITTPVGGSYGVAVDGVAPVGDYPATWLYDHRTPDADDAARLAQVRAQERSCQTGAYIGSGALPNLRAGSTFSLTGHQVTAFNREYLVTGVRHTARNADQSWSVASYSASQTASTGAYYSNDFTAIPASADVQFRPPRRTPKPSISGVLSATVYLQPDASQGSQSGGQGGQGGQAGQNNQGGQIVQVNPIPDYQGASTTANVANENNYVLPPPPMDEQGRYLVTLPFVDGTVTNGSPISAWIRMAQPTAGLWTGVQYMLEPGAEVLLAFVNGDPDLPVIVGAVYNGGIPAPLTSATTDPNI